MYKYRKFLIEKMEKEISKIKNKVTCETNSYYNFIDDELIGIVECKNESYIIVLNSYRDNVFKIDHDRGSYTISKKFSLKNKLSSKTFNKLLKHGLYETDYSGKNNNDNYFAIHRFICCLRENIKEKEVHHIDSNAKNNNINNLVSLTETEHIKITNKNRKDRTQNEKYIM